MAADATQRMRTPTDQQSEGSCRRPPPSAIPSAVVHELRTPLTAIHGYAQLLQRQASEQELVARGLDVILRETARMTRLLNELYEVAELDAGRFSLVPVNFTLAEVAEEVAARVREANGRHQIVVRADDQKVFYDRRRLVQMLFHVLTNAVAYSPKGGTIGVTLRKERDRLHALVTDSGIGIPGDESERVYDRYFRGRRIRKTGTRGLGLGLFVAREIAVRSGGRIWHEPTPDGGTAFHITVPTAVQGSA